MNTLRHSLVTALLGTGALLLSACAAMTEPQDGHRPVAAAAMPGGMAMDMRMGMGGGMASPAHAEHMKAMQAMHEKMLAAPTPEARQALLAEHMALMQKGMGLMEGMGSMGAMHGGAATATPDDIGARQAMLEQRMAMMQAMMQMMMDRMPPPAAAAR